MPTTQLGKIAWIRIGAGGYQDMMFGVTVSLSMKGTGVQDFKGMWKQSVDCTEDSKWDETDRSRQYDETMRWLDILCTQAKVDDAMDLVGKPVEVTFEGMQLVSWRLLTEVL